MEVGCPKLLNVGSALASGLTSVLTPPKGFEAGVLAPKENGDDALLAALWTFCPNNEVPVVPPNPNPLVEGFSPFTSIPAPRTGLSSMLTSWSARGGVTLRLDAAAVPKANGLLETSAPLVPLVGAPTVNGLLETSAPLLPLVGPPNSDTGVVEVGAPKLNAGLSVAATGGVEGGAPNENGDFAGVEGAVFAGSPNEKALGATDGFGASITGASEETMVDAVPGA